jgi:hypothetical protein
MLKDPCDFWAEADAALRSGDCVKRKTKRQDERRPGGNLLLVLAAALFVVLLLIRLLVFVAGHGRR